MKTKNENPELPALLVRLKEFMDTKHLTVYQVNKEANLCKGLLTNAYNKKQGLTTPTLEAILTVYPELNANWLLVGRGEMLNKDEAQETTSSTTYEQHLQHLNELQEQCMTMIKSIQKMKHDTEDARLLDQLK